MDRVDMAVAEFRKANRNVVNLPFKEYMSKGAQLHPYGAAARVLNRRRKNHK